MGKKLQINKDLELKLPEKEFATTLFDIFCNQREYMEEWLAWVNQIKTLDDCQKLLKDYRLYNRGGQKLMTFIFYQNQLVGSVALVKIDKENHSANIGYWISQSFQGKGIIFKSCQRLVQYAFEKMQINRLEINVNDTNSRSQKVAEKLGFQYEGKMRKAVLLHEKYHDVLKFSLLKVDWKRDR